MCRLAAYVGPKLQLRDLIFEPEHSLIEQSKHADEAKMSVNGDGFGVSWYGDFAEPGIFKVAQPAWSDQNLFNLSLHIKSNVIIAHVRAATSGSLEHNNCHPFAYGRFSFAHNGQIGGFDKIRRRLENVLSDDHFRARLGSTDSELLFYFLLANGYADNPQNAIVKTIKQVKQHAQEASIQHAFKFTFLCTDGQTVVGCRYSSQGKAPSLWFSQKLFQDGITMASEPLSRNAQDWQEIPNESMIMCKRGECEKYILPLNQCVERAL